MVDVPTPSELGFAEFVAKLLSEVFDGVVIAQADQERRHAELSVGVRLEPAEFADSFIGQEEADAELARLFPPDKPDWPHMVVEGAYYQPKGARVDEFPNFAEALGVQLTPQDYQKRQRGPATLKASAVEKLRHAARLILARRHLPALRETMARGIPRVVVDSGRVVAKLTFEVVTVEHAEEAEKAARLAAPIRPLARLSALSIGQFLPNVRLLVRQADERTPQTSQLEVDVFGEVEVTFKTVT